MGMVSPCIQYTSKPANSNSSFAGGVPLSLPASQAEVFCSLGSLHHPCPVHHVEQAGSPGMIWWQKNPSACLATILLPGSCQLPMIRLKEEASDFSSTASLPTPPASAGTRLTFLVFTIGANIQKCFNLHSSVEMFISESGV